MYCLTAILTPTQAGGRAGALTAHRSIGANLWAWVAKQSYIVSDHIHIKIVSPEGILQSPSNRRRNKTNRTESANNNPHTHTHTHVMRSARTSVWKTESQSAMHIRERHGNKIVAWKNHSERKAKRKLSVVFSLCALQSQQRITFTHARTRTHAAAKRAGKRVTFASVSCSA